MSLASTKRRNFVIATVIIVVLAVSSIGAVIYLLTKDNVTVSGQAFASTLVPATNIQTIQFQDIQTGTATTFHFPPQSGNTGNYSVTLKNGHTYNVYISYYVLSAPETDFITTFTVHAPDGKTAISQNFG